MEFGKYAESQVHETYDIPGQPVSHLKGTERARSPQSNKILDLKRDIEKYEQSLSKAPTSYNYSHAKEK